MSTEPNLPRSIGNPAKGALATIDVYRVEDLTQFTEREILKLHGMGPKALGILKAELEAKGLSFKQP